MCFLCLKMKYLDQIRAMLTVPLIHLKSVFASLTVQEPPLLFNQAQRIYTDAISKKYQIPI